MALRSLNGYYVLSRESAKNFNFEESAKKFMAFMKDFTPMDASTTSLYSTMIRTEQPSAYDPSGESAGFGNFVH